MAGYSVSLRRKTGQTEAGWVEGSINSFAAGAPILKNAAEDPRNNVNLVICLLCVSIQEKVCRSPKGFVRNGNERERERERREREERERGGGVAGVTRDELENELAGRSTLNQRHKCADLPPSWRLTSTRTHSLPRTELLVSEKFFKTRWISLVLPSPVADPRI